MYPITEQLLATTCYFQATVLRGVVRRANQAAADTLQRVNTELCAEYGVQTAANGLTPDVVKRDPRYKKAKLDFDRSFAQLREVNGAMNKKYAKEIRAERRSTMAQRTRTK